MPVADLPRVLQAKTTPSRLAPPWGTVSTAQNPFLFFGNTSPTSLLAVPGAAFLEYDSHWLALPESQGQPEWLGCADQALQVGTEAETSLCVMKSMKKKGT